MVQGPPTQTSEPPPAAPDGRSPETKARIRALNDDETFESICGRHLQVREAAERFAKQYGLTEDEVMAEIGNHSHVLRLIRKS